MNHMELKSSQSSFPKCYALNYNSMLPLYLQGIWTKLSLDLLPPSRSNKHNIYLLNSDRSQFQKGPLAEKYFGGQYTHKTWNTNYEYHIL